MSRPPRPKPAKTPENGPMAPAGPSIPLTSGGSAQVSGIDNQLVARAMRKLVNREELTREEQAALKRSEKDKEERLRWKFYGTIPQRHWRTMSGRQTKVINEQAQRYGLPFGGPIVDLPALARALHDFLADNALKLSRDEDELMQGSGSPALERYREERAAIARLDRLDREKQLLPRDAARQALGSIAAILRGAGDTLQRQFGVAAGEILYEALDDAQREIERSFTVGSAADPEPEGNDGTADDDDSDTSDA